MVEKTYFKKLPGLADALGEEYILMAGRRITARMVVYNNEADCPRPEGGEKEIPDRDDSPVHCPLGKMLFSYSRFLLSNIMQIKLSFSSCRSCSM